MAMVSRKEITSSLIFIMLGVGYLVYNTYYPLDTLNNPGPGVFPLILGSILILLAIYQLAHVLQKRRLKEYQVKEQPQSVKGTLRGLKNESGPFILGATFAIYIILLPWMGFFISNFLFVVICSRLIGARDWKRPLSLAIGIDLFCYLLFEIWLKLSLPRGHLI